MPARRQVYIPARDHAAAHGWIESAVVHRIRAGIYDGEKVDGEWYVLRHRTPEAERSQASPSYRFEASEPAKGLRRKAPWEVARRPLAQTVVYLVLYGALALVAGALVVRVAGLVLG